MRQIKITDNCRVNLSFAERGRSYECTSFVETQATALLKEFPVEFVKYPFQQIVLEFAVYYKRDRLSVFIAIGFVLYFFASSVKNRIFN